MKQGRFTEEQMVAILRVADSSSVTEVSRKHKISKQTIDTGRSNVSCRWAPINLTR